MYLRPASGVSFGLQYEIPASAEDVAEVIELEVTGGADVDVDGDFNITLPGGSPLAVAVIGGILPYIEIEITGAPSAAGNITFQLSDTESNVYDPVVVAVLDTDDTTSVATKVIAAFELAAFENITVSVGGNASTVRLTYNTLEETFTLSSEFTDTGTTGVTESTTVYGVDTPDTLEEIAGAIRNTSFEGWTTGGEGAVVTFTKDEGGPISGELVFDDNATGVTITSATVTQGVDNSITFDFRSGGSDFPYGLASIVNIFTANGLLQNPRDLKVTYPNKGVVTVNGTLVAGTIINLVAQRDCLNAL